jgi:hypothetical protein
MSGPVYLYCFGREGGPFKVGRSRNPKARVSTILDSSSGAAFGGPDSTMLHMIKLPGLAEADAAEREPPRLGPTV